MTEVDALLRIAGSLGMTLGREEASVFLDRVVARSADIDEFMRLRLPVERPPLLAPERAPGGPPTAAEDPFNAWLWKCEISAGTHGVLNGRTVSFKDHIAVAGIPLTLGSYLLEGYAPDFDATIVTRVLSAGAVIIGKNSMNGPTSSWGTGVPSDHLRPRNPHDPDHLTGGSSSGSAAAVAAGDVDIAFGGDQGGSIRIPAAYCGVYGLKPTFGLVSHFGIGFGSEQSLDHTGPMARRVEDIAAALDAVAGYDGYDPRQDRTVPLSVNTRGSLADGPRGLRLGVLDEGFVDAAPDVRAAVTSAVDVLVSAGAEAVRVSIPEHSLANSVHDILEIEGSRAIFDVGFFGAWDKTYYPPTYIDAAYRLYREHIDRLKPKVKLNLLLSQLLRERFHGTLYAKAQNVRSAITKAFDRAFDRFDVLVMPTCLSVAPKYVEPKVGAGGLAFEPTGAGGLPRTRSTSPFNFTGHPALTVPCGRSAGLPIGMQLVGRYYDEKTLLRTAYSFQHSVDWDEMTGLPSASAKTRIDRRVGHIPVS